MQGRAWSDAEDRTLALMRTAGHTTIAIGRALGRSPAAVQRRANDRGMRSTRGPGRYPNRQTALEARAAVVPDGQRVTLGRMRHGPAPRVAAVPLAGELLRLARWLRHHGPRPLLEACAACRITDGLAVLASEFFAIDGGRLTLIGRAFAELERLGWRQMS